MIDAGSNAMGTTCMTTVITLLALYLYVMGWLFAISLIEPAIRKANPWWQTIVFALWPLLPPLCFAAFLYDWFKAYRSRL